MQHFALSIQVWYRLNHRKLPWRETKDAYNIWLSEIIMQQTRVEQGKPYFNKFVKHYPKVNDLAKANEQEVLKLWQGLGYYSRARNMYTAAQQIMEKFDGIFPDNYKDIKSLKGVGDYTASAIASFAYDLPYAVLDGNVFRVLSRYFNDDTPIDTTQGRKAFKAYASELLNEEDPAEFNQAIMELGALVCKPKNPDCLNCPVADSCLAYREGNPLKLPVKAKKVKVATRYFHYLVYPSQNVQLEKRKGKGIWQNMYQFPMVEKEKVSTQNEVDALVNHKYGVKLVRKIFAEQHILTHQKINATYWEVSEALEEKDIVSPNLKALAKYPLPRLIERFIENHIVLFL